MTDRPDCPKCGCEQAAGQNAFGFVQRGVARPVYLEPSNELRWTCTFCDASWTAAAKDSEPEPDDAEPAVVNLRPWWRRWFGRRIPKAVAL